MLAREPARLWRVVLPCSIHKGLNPNNSRASGGRQPSEPLREPEGWHRANVAQASRLQQPSPPVSLSVVRIVFQGFEFAVNRILQHPLPAQSVSSGEKISRALNSEAQAAYSAEQILAATEGPRSVRLDF